jgi:DNA polymerase I-like protein with 3'-5' exonuclease and polymerase domains
MCNVTGVIYGMGAKMAAERLQIDVCKVYTITSAFFAKYKGLKNWISFVKKEATKQGYVSTIFGRRRYLPEIHSPDIQEKAKAERQAVNTVIQGSASDLLKHVMLRVECLLNEAYSTSEADTTHCDPRSLRPRLLMQVHDELIYEIPLCESSNENYSLDSNVLNFIPLVTRYMNSTVVDELGFHVPLEVNTTIGLVWGRMRKFSDSCQLEKCNTETPHLKRIPVAAAEVKLDKELSSTLIGKRSVD